MAAGLPSPSIIVPVDPYHLAHSPHEILLEAASNPSNPVDTCFGDPHVQAQQTTARKSQLAQATVGKEASNLP